MIVRSRPAPRTVTPLGIDTVSNTLCVPSSRTTVAPSNDASSASFRLVAAVRGSAYGYAQSGFAADVT